MSESTNRPDLFNHVVGQLLNGHSQIELSKKLSECVAAVQETGKQATLTLKLTVKPVGRDTGQFEVRDLITTNKPQRDKGMTLLFGTAEGNLQRNDPNQMDLKLKSVDEETTGELKQVNE